MGYGGVVRYLVPHRGTGPGAVPPLLSVPPSMEPGFPLSDTFWTLFGPVWHCFGLVLALFWTILDTFWTLFREIS